MADIESRQVKACGPTQCECHPPASVSELGPAQNPAERDLAGNPPLHVGMTMELEHHQARGQFHGQGRPRGTAAKDACHARQTICLCKRG